MGPIAIMINVTYIQLCINFEVSMKIVPLLLTYMIKQNETLQTDIIKKEKQIVNENQN